MFYKLAADEPVILYDNLMPIKYLFKHSSEVKVFIYGNNDFTEQINAKYK